MEGMLAGKAQVYYTQLQQLQRQRIHRSTGTKIIKPRDINITYKFTSQKPTESEKVG